MDAWENLTATLPSSPLNLTDAIVRFSRRPNGGTSRDRDIILDSPTSD